MSDENKQTVEHGTGNDSCAGGHVGPSNNVRRCTVLHVRRCTGPPRRVELHSAVHFQRDPLDSRLLSHTAGARMSRTAA